MIDAPFPAGVAFSLTQVAPEAVPSLSPAEAALISPGAHPARRAAFSAGRAAAHQAIAALGLPNTPILRDPRGAPVWPGGVVGAISHTKNWAAAAAGREEVYSALGLDLEHPSRFTELEIERRIGNAAERAWVEAGGADRVQRRAALFTAKEAIFKAFAPRVEKFFGFDAAEIEPPAGDAAGARILFDVPGVIRSGERFIVRFSSAEDLLAAGVAIPRS